ncbi:MAG: Fatty acid desaturase (EC; Delta-9 fatty acid desaturase (EC [uncultured Caballeronia sp.]|nr:MAG: Fatty acid desaturase (EC; Delta-9 fatty acid desaturase (EC [uncultured Caballeronia sp.]
MTITRSTTLRSDADTPPAARFDRVLALVIVALPAVGAALAIALWIAGHGPGLVEWTVFGVFYFATALGLEVGFHRHITHKAFNAPPWGRASLIAMGSMGVRGPVNSLVSGLPTT